MRVRIKTGHQSQWRMFNGLHKMGTFYHITKQEFLDDILEQGLKSRAETGKQGWVEVHGNPKFIYLSNRPLYLDELNARMEEAGVVFEDDVAERLILEVDLPQDHPVERDYDQILVYKKIDPIVFARRFPGISKEDMMRGILQHFAGISYDGDFSDESLMAAFDKIPDDVYDDKLFGCYRTKQSISPEHLSIHSESAHAP